MLRELIPSDLVKASSPDDWKRVSTSNPIGNLMNYI